MSPLLDLIDSGARARICDENKCVSWSEMLARTKTVERGTHFLEGGNSIEQAVVLLAGASGLCSAVPLNPRWTINERMDVCRKFDNVIAPPGIFVATSGSQGRAKLVHLAPDALVRHAASVNAHLQVDENDVWLASLPFFHVGGLAVILRCALARAGLVMTEKADAKTIAESLERGVTLASFVPTILRRVLTYGKRELPDSLRAIILGGGPVPQDLIESCLRVLPTYGLTEAGSMVTCARPGCAEHERVTAGVPLSHAEVKIVDETNQEVQQGTSGRIVVKSAGAATGYWQSENETARTFREGWILTEDSGFLDERGCLHVLGRRDRLIVCGGENVALEEVEAATRSLPQIRDVLCIGLEEPEWGHVVALIVESDQDVPLEVLREQLRDKLAAFKLPRKALTVSQLPLLANGKPDYAAAKKLFWQVVP